MGPKIVYSSENEVIKEWHGDTNDEAGLPDEEYWDDDAGSFLDDSCPGLED